MSLVQVVTGLAIAAIVALLIGKGLSTSLKGLNATALRQESQLESQQIAMQLQRDFLRRQPLSIRLPDPTVFTAASGCKGLTLGQTILSQGVRTIEYKTECTGPAFADEGSRATLYPGLSEQCAGRPRLRVITTQPDGKTSERVYPSKTELEAALLCVHTKVGFSHAIAAELVLGRLQGGRWKTTVKAIPLGLESGGKGIEIIPPQ